MVIQASRRIAVGVGVAGLTSLLFAAGAMAALDAGGQPSFNAAQVAAGQAVYAKSCAACHGAALEGKVGPAMAGAVFDKSWRGKALKEFYDVTAETMPQTAPGSLSDTDNLAVTAFVLSKNGYAPGAAALTKANLAVVLGAASARVAAAAPAAGGDVHPPPEEGPNFGPPPAPNTTPISARRSGPNQTYPIGPAEHGVAGAAAPSDKDIVNIPAGDWLTYNRTLKGDRYSPLSQINAANVARLVPKCIFQLGEAGSFQNNPLVRDGVMYVTSAHKVFAVDAATCVPKWGYTYVAADPERFASTRGMALYEGKLFKGTADGHLIALDAGTGKLLWEAIVDDSNLGYCVSGAPMAFAGKVVVGECGGDNGIKGHIHAFDATTGKPLWTFDTIPTGTQLGAETWGGGTAQGGGPSWSTATVDPERNLIIYPIGNPGPDFNGDHRPGINLYTSSVVALDIATGKFAWYAQQVPHDIHDWDTAAAPTLYERGGKRYMAVASKDGHLYIYDADTRKELAKAETQSRYENGDKPLSYDKPTTYCPGAHGQWNGAGYSPMTGLLFVGSEERCDTVQIVQPNYLPGRGYYAARIMTDQSNTGFGWIKGFDAVTGKVAWAYKSPKPVTAAMTPTAGGVLFTGDTAGRFLALDQKTGKVLYQFNTGGSVAGGMATYLAGGKQLVAVASGNTSRDVAAPYGAATIVVFGLP
ncbi:MAG: PQQ-binding-like beta-propeller repeat protein [Caulobacteraceae bacterium]